MEQSNWQLLGVFGLSGTCFSQKFPLPLSGSSPPRNTLFSGQVHSSSETTSQSIQPFLYGSQMLCCKLHCQWERKPVKITPFLWDFVILPEEDRATSICYGYKNLVKIARMVPYISSEQTDRHTQTHVHHNTS